MFIKFINWERKGNFKAKQSVALTSLIMKPANADTIIQLKPLQCNWCMYLGVCYIDVPL